MRSRARIASAGAGQAAQTDTDWGRIWDSLPEGFPRYAGSAASEEAATGPASAVLAVQGADAKTIATFYQGALSSVLYTTDGLSGPLENGGYVLDMTGPASGCKVQVAAVPTGGLVTVTILYGAACPLGDARQMQPGWCGGATHRSPHASILQLHWSRDRFRPSLGEARSCNQRSHAISGPSPSWWGCSWSCSSSA